MRLQRAVAIVCGLVLFAIGLALGVRVGVRATVERASSESVAQAVEYRRVRAERDFMRSVLVKIDKAWEVKEKE